MAERGRPSRPNREHVEIFQSFEWLLRDDIRRKQWDMFRARVDAMRREMSMFGRIEKADELIRDRLGEI